MTAIIKVPEIVDIINKNDEVIDRMSKKEAHDKGLLHRCVLAITRRTNGNYVMTINAPHKQDPNLFVPSIGGHVKSGEEVDKAMEREAEEEMGFKDFTYEFIGNFTYDRDVEWGREKHYFYFYEVISDEEVVLNDECIGYEEFTEDELKIAIKKTPEKFAPQFFMVLDKFYKEN